MANSLPLGRHWPARGKVARSEMSRARSQMPAERDLAIRKCVKTRDVVRPIGRTVVSRMKSVPEGFICKARRAIVLNGLAGGELALLDPIHQIPRALTTLRDLVNANIEELPFSGLNGPLKYLPIFVAPGSAVLEEVFRALVSPPGLRASRNINRPRELVALC